MEIWVTVFIVLALIIIKVWYDEKTYEKKLRHRLMCQWGKLDPSEYTAEKIDAISAFYYSHVNQGDIDDITWNDLEMDLIYQQMNNTQSAMGQEYLYDLLRRPKLSHRELADREHLISFFQEEEQQRLKLQIKLAAIGKMGKYSVYQYLCNVKNLKEENSVFHILQMLALFISGGLCFVWFI